MSDIGPVVNEVYDALYHEDDPESFVQTAGHDNVFALRAGDGEVWFIGVGRAVSPNGDVLREVPS